MNKRTGLILGIGLLVGFWGSACGAAPAATALPPAPVVAASATTAEGKLLPLQSANLSFNTGGLVAEILVKEGDPVPAGAVLARLSNESLRAAVAEAEAGLAVAKANQTAYRMRLPQQIAAAEADIKSATAQQISAAVSRDTQPTRLEVEAVLAQAKYTQQQIETAINLLTEYDKFHGKRADELRAQLDQAIKAVQAAEAQLAALQAGSLRDRASGAQAAAAAASATASQVRLAQLKSEAAGQAVDVYQAAIQQAEAGLLAAQLALSETEIRAPFAGSVTKFNIQVGEQAIPGAAAFVLADLSGWRIETDNLTELKVPVVEVGRPVSVIVDALPEVELKGRVASIGAVSQLKSGDVVYVVKVELLDGDPRLRWGMTVAVKFEQ